MDSAEPASRLAQAFAYAELLHRGQTRKKTLAPVLSHLMAVSSLVLESGGDEEETMAALLHDGPEDCAGQQTLDQIRRTFGDRVARIVEGCTDSLETPKPSWKRRKARYLDHLPTADESVRLVSLADKVHNVRSLVLEHRWIGDNLFERFSASKEETLWYYDSLLRIFESTPAERLARLTSELARAVEELHGSFAGGPFDPAES